MTQWSAATVGLVLALGFVTLTDAQSQKVTVPAHIFGSNGPKATTLVSGTSWDAYGVLSPDESAIAYVDWVTLGAHLAVRDLRTGAVRIIAASSQKKDSYDYASSPVWSPDSKSIAYQWNANDSSVRMASREGGEAKILSTEYCTPMDWSRDGKSLLIETNGKLATIEIATGQLRPIGPKGTHARFSPDGRFDSGQSRCVCNER
jgi:Tol biopolymer transport system component